MYVRDPRSRVEKVAPFLTIDGDPYPAMVDGRIQWILDGYTTSATYPYSQKINLQQETRDELTNQGTFALARDNVNYMRNSVKATVDAYDGTVTLYQFGADDPILDAWNRAFGGHLVKPASEITPELAAHFRYPEDQFKVQRDLLTRYHVSNPQDFFSGQDFWQVPNDPANENTGLQPPYYLLAQFPNQAAPTFQLTAAMTLRTQPNLSALVTGYYGADGTPQLQVLQTTQVLGPTQVQQKMQNDPNVRTQLSLYTSANSQVEYGNLLSLPLGNGILYVEPVYIKSTNPGSYPLMKKVLLNYGDFVAFADDTAGGITDLLSQAKKGVPSTTPPTTPTNPSPSASATSPPTAPPTTAPPTTVSPPGAGNSAALNAAILQINKALADLKKAQQDGAFAAQGQALEELNNAIAAYEKALNSTASPGPPGTPTPTPTR
jgi:uncharacterized membrane protein (UPF0182 family)